MQDQFDSFREVVLRDRRLQERLRGPQDESGFVDQVIRLGAECGYQFTAHDVEAAMKAARRSWLERWI